MKLRNKWEGITLELLKKADAPLAFKQRFEGTDEATKVLVHNEQVNIDGATIKIGGFEYEVEMSVDESIQQIKNISEICRIIREEVINFIDFGTVVVAKVDDITKAEKPIGNTFTAANEIIPAEKDLSAHIKESIASALASFNITKS